MYGAAERVAAVAPPLSTRVAACVLLAAAVLFALVSGRDPGFARLHVERGAAAGRSHHASAAFAVDAAPFSHVELRVNGRPAASGYVPWDGHRVRFARVALDDGTNAVVARTALWYAAFERAHADEVRVFNPPSRTNRAHPQRLATDPAATRLERTLTLTVHQREAAAAFTVRLAASDRALAALSTRADLAGFVDDVFDGPRMNRASVAALFRGVHPSVVRTRDEVVVRAATGYRDVGLEDLPAFRGDLELANDGAASGTARHWGHDVVRLQLAGYRAVERVPAPLREDGTTAVWDRPATSARAPIVVSVAFAPFSSFDALRRTLDLPVFAFVPHVAARFLAFLHGFELALPMFVYLALSRGRDARYARIARRLIAVAVAADVFDACISAQPDVDGELRLIAPLLDALPAPLVNLLIVPGAIGAVLGLLALSIAHLAARRPTLAGRLVADAARAVSWAAFAFVAIAAAAFAGGIVAHDAAASALFAAFACASGLAVLLARLDWWTLAGRGPARIAFTVVTAAVVALASLPLPLVADGTLQRIPEFAGTAFANPQSLLPLSASFVRSLAPLCPLLFGILLIAGARSAPAAAGLDGASLRRLLLCCYGVPAGVVVIVPLGFLLAWWSYRVLPLRGAEPAASRGAALVPLALAFAGVDVLLQLPPEMRHLQAVQTPFVALDVAGAVAAIVQSFVLPAVALGACGAIGIGRAGMRRGVALGAWAAACSLPAWFLQSNGAAVTLAAAALTMTFYVVAGTRSTFSPQVALPPRG